MKKKDKMFSNVDTLVKESKQNEEREDQQEEKMENFEKSTDKRLRVVEARAVIPGPPGRDGRDGNRGEPGHRGRDGRDGLAGEVGTPGKTGRPGTPGKRGPEGKQGPKGDDGVGLTLKSFQIGASYNRGDYLREVHLVREEEMGQTASPGNQVPRDEGTEVSADPQVLPEIPENLDREVQLGDLALM
eukprot:g5542.t1